jgi:hypothetical protein
MKKYFVPLGLENGVDYEFYQYFTPMGQIYVHIFLCHLQFGKDFLFPVWRRVILRQCVIETWFRFCFFLQSLFGKDLSFPSVNTLKIRCVSQM